MTFRDTYRLCSVSGICLEGGPLCKHDTFQPKATKFGMINRLGWACFNGRQFPRNCTAAPSQVFFGFGPAPLRTPTQCNIVTMFYTVTELREGQLIFGRRCAVCRNTAILACRMSRLLLAPAAVAGPAHAYRKMAMTWTCVTDVVVICLSLTVRMSAGHRSRQSHTTKIPLGCAVTSHVYVT